MNRLPTPALVWLAAFSSATGTWLIGSWIHLLSGYAIPPEGVYSVMALSAVGGGLGALLSRVIT